jgi:hypothetical protein
MTRAPWNYSGGDYAPCPRCQILRPRSAVGNYGNCEDKEWCDRHNGDWRAMYYGRNGRGTCSMGAPSDERGLEVGGDGSKRQKGNQEG